MADVRFIDAYAGVLPEHEVFAECEACGDMGEHGVAILSMATQLGDVIAANLAMAGTPPEVLDFVLSVVVSSAVLRLASVQKTNTDKTCALELMPQIRTTLEALASRLSAEVDRMERAAAEMAAQEVAGSC